MTYQNNTKLSQVNILKLAKRQLKPTNAQKLNLLAEQLQAEFRGNEHISKITVTDTAVHIYADMLNIKEISKLDTKYDFYGVMGSGFSDDEITIIANLRNYTN